MKAMISLTNEEKESYEKQICHICEKEFCTDKENKIEFKLKQKSQRPLSLHRKMQRSCSQYLYFTLQNNKRDPSSIS